jgi:H+/gluconate symporter-like permease
MFDLAAVLIALALLVLFAYRGITLILLAPIAALVAVALTGGLPILAAYTQVFMSGAGQFFISFFPLFMLGAIFGRLMDDSGAAASIARAVSRWLGRRRAIAAVVLCCAVLTYGGVSAFVVAFAVYPVAAELFRRADIPKRLIPGTLALGAFSFTMSALPGTPAIQNAIPMPFFGTTAFAAPGLGVVSALIMLAFGLVWLERRAAQARVSGEGYGLHSDSVPETDTATREFAQSEGYDLREIPAHPDPEHPDHVATLPPFSLAVLPVVVVIVASLAFLEVIVPRLDTGYLAEPRFGATTIEAVRGVWSVIFGLFLAILLLIGANWRRLTDLRTSLDSGTNASVLPIINTASLVGFGSVIAALPVFSRIADAVLVLGGNNPLISVASSVAILSAMTGSASGGMSIALDSLGATLVQQANAAGVSLAAMHRVTAVASGALDALPHNGAVITLLAVCRLTHKTSYFDVFMTSVVGPALALVVIIVLASLFGGF